MAVRSLSDIAAIEAVPLIERDLPESTYAALVASAKRTPNATALTFFRSADRLDDTHVWTYAELVADVTRAANVFAALGVATDRPAAFVLPNLPETHFTIWGGEAAGAALAINPMLEPRQIADLLRSARASVLVTLAPALNPKAWPVLAAELATLPDLTAIAFVDMADYLDAEQREAARGSIQAAATTPASRSSICGMRCASSPPTVSSRAARSAPTTYPPMSAPAARQARRRLRCARIGTRCSTPGPLRKCLNLKQRRASFSAACRCST